MAGTSGKRPPARNRDEPIERGGKRKPARRDEPISKENGILVLLQQLVEGQKEIINRLEIIELNQTTLSQAQATLNLNQELLVNKLEPIDASIVPKPEMMECKVAITREQNSLCRMTGESCDKAIDEVASMLPLRTIAAVNEVEESLDSSDFAQAMTSYLHKVKGVSEDVSSVIRAIFTDDLLEKYNWDGRCEKHSLANLILLNKIVRDVFQKQGAFNYEKSVKKAVERAHHRMKQKKYLKEKAQHSF